MDRSANQARQNHKIFSCLVWILPGLLALKVLFVAICVIINFKNPDFDFRFTNYNEDFLLFKDQLAVLGALNVFFIIVNFITIICIVRQAIKKLKQLKYQQNHLVKNLGFSKFVIYTEWMSLFLEFCVTVAYFFGKEKNRDQWQLPLEIVAFASWIKTIIYLFSVLYGNLILIESEILDHNFRELSRASMTRRRRPVMLLRFKITDPNETLSSNGAQIVPF